ncbi:Uncharacterized conserved protein [Kingella potus]|uniref:Uncharacterized conserved protein n=1 Tax=Kingella potus TaxID=265175 RepID=A0A377R1E3_9NEIS|nr:YkvA family protein [Kingella potus]UOP00251.1 DUF1232 domain-containing protein [Kingella potus]STR02690.1 Uncharacterized conserved protein [Kingella potus]
MTTPAPEDYIPAFRRRKIDETGLLRKLARHAVRLGTPAVRQIYALYYLYRSPDTPAKAKFTIAAALLYFVSPVDTIPDLLLPLGFTDDIAVLAIAYSQIKTHLTEDILARAREAADRLLRR